MNTDPSVPAPRLSLVCTVTRYFACLFDGSWRSACTARTQQTCQYHHTCPSCANQYKHKLGSDGCCRAPSGWHSDRRAGLAICSPSQSRSNRLGRLPRSPVCCMTRWETLYMVPSPPQRIPASQQRQVLCIFACASGGTKCHSLT